MEFLTGMAIISVFISILKDTTAILYGRIAEPGEFKYQVLLRLTKGGASGVCGGGIIDQTHILTAWHCVEGLGRDNIEVVVGAVKFSGDPNEKLHSVKEIRLHRSRSCKLGERRCYDIAVITVSEAMIFTEFVDAIPLPEEDYQPGEECVFAGWGVTELNAYKTSDILRYGEGKIFARMFCVGWLFTMTDYEFCFHRVRGSLTTINSVRFQVALGQTDSLLILMLLSRATVAHRSCATVSSRASSSEGLLTRVTQCSLSMSISYLGSFTATRTRRVVFWEMMSERLNRVMLFMENDLFLNTTRMHAPPIIISLLLFFLFLDIGAVFFGQLASPGTFKYQVLIHTRRIIFTEVCGGAIVDETHIVTAWHCVDRAKPENIDITVGATVDIGDANAKLHKVLDIRLHESKSCVPGQLRCYDIAVIRVTQPFEYNDFVGEVSLPDSDITVGAECVFAGFGASEDNPEENSEFLRYGYGTIWATQKCNKKLPTLKDYEFCFHHKKDASMTTVPGHGDSGGPFVCDGVLTGVIIRGGYYMIAPTTAINVYSVLDFIKAVLDADNCAAAAVEFWETFRWRP